ncbi:hypothetical protein RFI_05433 [Reticulomyxa filosa]|uniref:PNPLA domain-containing protein n=1 Tax=Reticulomyxa filosa TaxID=46433 RepID=X6P297_RETFI|nr:hypothetical protein RFI_05433 [Reticulomyxa filosa]|eukprot:ETO31682.1 hypothetical protein RFI_05433 [Reticulomyxa filosa]
MYNNNNQRRFWRTGKLLDAMVLRDAIREDIGHATFLEAYEKTGRILNITVTGTDTNAMPRLLNYLTAPNVVVWSAVVASCAIPLVFGAQELHVKEITVDHLGNESLMIHPIFLQGFFFFLLLFHVQKKISFFFKKKGMAFEDGSLAHDLPMNRLQQLFNVDNFIVSQVNPHLVPLLLHSLKAPIPLFGRIFRFLGDEFRLYLSSVLINLRELSIVSGFQSFTSSLSQRYTGDVTVVPYVKSSDYLRLLTNPTDEHIQKCLRISERSAWEVMSRIEGLCAIEICLDDCLQTLRMRALVLEKKLSQQFLSSSTNRLIGTPPNERSPAYDDYAIHEAEEEGDPANQDTFDVTRHQNLISNKRKPQRHTNMSRISSFLAPIRNDLTASFLISNATSIEKSNIPRPGRTGVAITERDEEITIHDDENYPESAGTVTENNVPSDKQNKAFHRSVSFTELVSEVSSFP